MPTHAQLKTDGYTTSPYCWSRIILINRLYTDHPGSRVGIRNNRLVIQKTDSQEPV